MEEMMDHRNRAKLIDVLERRGVAEPFEFRMDNTTGMYMLRGYAATWDPYDCYGGPDAGGWVEHLGHRSMDRTLDQRPDLMLLVNHEGLPLARTVSDTLHLKTDRHGLLTRADLDPDDPDVQRLAPKLKPQANGRSNMDEMSFSFRVKQQSWSNDYTQRDITELSLQKGDVSVVNYGMNPNTHVEISTPQMIDALAQLSNKELLEVRGMDRLTLQKARQMLDMVCRADDRASTVNFDGSHLLYDGQCVTCQGERAKKPHGDVTYADPGYLGPDGKQAHDGNGVARYPIDEAHVQAAWSYINMPKNQKGYTAEQLSAIKSRIRAAMKKAGHDVSDEKANEAPAAEFSHYDTIRSQNGGTTLVAVMTDGSRTPLPSFRQSGQLAGAGAGDGGNPFGVVGNVSVKVGGGGGGASGSREMIPVGQLGGSYSVTPRADEEPDPEDPNEGQEPGEKPEDKPKRAGDKEPDPNDPNEPNEPPDEEKSERAHSAAECDDPNCPVHGDNPEKADRAAGNEEDPPPDDQEPDDRSVNDRLRELRNEAELPDLPTVSEGLAFLKALA